MEADPAKRRELASWHREFAERTGNPTIWEARLRTAEDLDAQADVIDRARAPLSRTRGHSAEPRRRSGKSNTGGATASTATPTEQLRIGVVRREVVIF